MIVRVNMFYAAKILFIVHLLVACMRARALAGTAQASSRVGKFICSNEHLLSYVPAKTRLYTGSVYTRIAWAMVC